MERRRIRSTLFAIAGSLCLFGAMATSASCAQAAETITVGTIRGIPTVAWPLYIAIDKGMFADEGLDVKVIGVGFAYQIGQQVVGGSLNIGGALGLIEAVKVAAKGAHVAIIREEGALPPFILMAKSDVKTIADLKGKTVSLGGVNDSTVVYFKRMLAPAGLKLSQVDKVYAGSAADRFSQLRSGAVDAALLLPPFDYLAEVAGYKDLGDTKDYVKDLPFTGYVVSDEWGKSHEDALKRFLAAYQKGVDWFYDTNNRAEAVKIIVGLSPKSDPVVIGKTYDSLRRLQFFAKTDVVPKRHLENLISLLNELGTLSGSVKSNSESGASNHPVKPEDLILPGVTNYRNN